MSRFRLVLSLTLLLSLATAAAPLAAAGGHATSSPALSVWTAFWESLEQAAKFTLTMGQGVCEKGPLIDPNGRCAAAAAPVTPKTSGCTNHGPLIDPDGGCTP